MMYLVFYRTSDVFNAEEQLKKSCIETEIVPTPVQDKAYCGVCVKIEPESYDMAKNVLVDMEYQTI